MDIVSLLTYLADRRRMLVRIMLAAMALLVLLDIVLPPHYDRFPWETIGGFGAFYGLFSAMLLIGVAKALGYVLLYRPEDYYDEQTGGEYGADAMAEDFGGDDAMSRDAGRDDRGSDG